MNRKLRIVLAILGAISFFIFFLEVFASLTAAFIGTAIGFCLIWLLAGFLHWLCAKRLYYVKKNQEYMNKQILERTKNGKEEN